MTVSPDHYAGFLQRIGHRVRNVDGMWWFNTSRGVYTCIPSDLDLDPTSVPVRQVLGRDGVVARFGCPVQQGVSSFRLICDDPGYHVDQLRGWTRTQVRRGLELCRTEQVPFDVLTKQAIPLNADTLIRQGRRVPVNLVNYWQTYFAEAAKTEGAEAWGSFVDGELAAYLISFTINDVANIVIMRSAIAHLKKFPNNALLYQFLYERVRDSGLRHVGIGYASMQAGLESLDQFKLRMGFRMAPVGQRVEMASWLKPFVNQLTAGPACQLLRRFTDSETAGKFEGMLKWYHEQPDLRIRHAEVRAA
jgi:hypothetical protein